MTVGFLDPGTSMDDQFMSSATQGELLGTHRADLQGFRFVQIYKKYIKERLRSKTGVTAQNRFTWAKIVPNLNSVYPGRAVIAKRGMVRKRTSYPNVCTKLADFSQTSSFPLMSLFTKVFRKMKYMSGDGKVVGNNGLQALCKAR